VDTGVFEGGEVSMYYDPMIAKVITHGVNREEATTHMRSALDRFLIRGVSHNISFLSALMTNPRYVAGNMTTNLIGDEYPEGFQATDLSHRDPTVFISVAASMMRGYRDRAAQIDGQLDGHKRLVPDDWIVVMNNEHHPVSVIPVQGGYDVQYKGHTYVVRSKWEFGQPIFEGTINGEQVFIQVLRENQTYRLLHDGSQVDVSIVTPKIAELLKYMPEKAPPDLSSFLLSPMPGLLVSVAVTEGDVINTGQELAVLEAMKMENTLLAERDGVVARVHYKPGANLAVDDVIMEFE
jgi:propionyl-CoA carboxylase alpha chain